MDNKMVLNHDCQVVSDNQKNLTIKDEFTCCLIGDDTLLISCAEILLNKNHAIVGIISTNTAIQKWADERQVRRFTLLCEAKETLKSFEFDYLFSIANAKILQADEIALPKKLAINYHYALLPRYAGTYATSWAILNDEKTHGITWHVMTTKIDGGDILKQKQFSIDKNETALTLNLKCFEYAVPSFEELVTELEDNQFTLKKQDLSVRNYSPLKKRPPKNGVIYWKKPAQDIYRLHRALTFGNYFNQLGVLKLILGKEVFHIKELKPLTVRSIAAPGTIIQVSEQALQVSTTTFDVEISKICTLEGSPLLLSDLIKRFKIRVGYQLSIPEQSFFEQLEEIAASYVQYEEHWLEALTKINPGKEAFFACSKDNPLTVQHVSTIQIPSSVYASFKSSTTTEWQPKNMLLTAILIYLYRINDCDNFSVSLTEPELLLAAAPFGQYYTTSVPLTSQLSPHWRFSEALNWMIEETRSLRKNKTYSQDIGLRYPQLSHCLNLALMNIEVVEDISAYRPRQSPLDIVVSRDASEIHIFSDASPRLAHLSTLISHFSSHILELLVTATKNPDTPISQLSFLNNTEKQKILLDWNNTETVFSEDYMTHQLFEKQVLKTPHHVAVVFKDQELTFAALNERANQLAHYLKQFNPLPNELIAICTERSLEMVIAILAVLKVGSAYVPLDPKYPNERLSYMLEDSNAKILVLNNPTLKQPFKNYNGIIVDLTQQQEIITQPKTNLAWTGTPQDLAYVIYTSGTTGTPKGVAIPHLALLNHMLWMIPKFNFTEKNIFLQKTPFSFDASIWEFFAPLLSGGKLIMAEEGDPSEMLALIKKHQVNVLQVVPSLLRQFLEDNEFQSCDSLEQVFSGGEALLPNTIQLFFNKMGNKKLYNLYGPTETTIQVTTHHYQARELETESSILIGKPINNIQVYVLDKHLNPVPVGLTGELYIGGISLSRGYLNRSELTQRRFIQNPFSQQLNQKLYKTGDRVRWLSDGTLEYIGRLDEQVKLNGFRIELSEIESVLLQHESIQDCAVLIQENSGLNHNNSAKHLVVYYVKKQNVTQIDTEDFVKTWEALYESQYAFLDKENYKANVKGWKSSYTEKTIEKEEMLEWVNNTVDRIKQLKPKTILEIGSGSGLVLFNILEDCEYYYATDFSKNAINYTRNVVENLKCSHKVKAIASAAAELSYATLEKPYDTVVINSVIQYFPNLEYLENVLLSAILNMKDSGQIFIGDVRDFRLLKCFHYSVLSYKQQNVTKAEVEYFALRDKELLISPEYFLDLKTRISEITAVEILPKLGESSHEMNNYRYDVVLHIKKPIQVSQSIQEAIFNHVIEFKSHFNANCASDIIPIKYPNKKIAKDYLEYCRLFGIMPKNASFELDNLFSIPELIRFAELQNFNAEFFIDLSDPLYLYIILISKNSSMNGKKLFIEYNAQSISRNHFASDPLATQSILETEYSQQLKDFLSQKLPSYMIPSRYISLEKMPLNLHGKIDKSALFEPHLMQSGKYLAPITEVEMQMCRIYAQVLGLPEDNVGINDDFFSLGGHSLSALRALSLAKKIFDIQLPTRALFEYPTIKKLSTFIEKAMDNPTFISQQNLIASPLIVLQKNGFKAPLFIIHPLGGTIFWYKALSRYMGNERPIYAIQDPGIQTNKLLFNSLEEMANFYLGAIQEIQPKGSYLLAGASFGGTVAIEIANQLLKSGEKVNFIGLLDAWPFYSEKFWEKSFLEKLMLRQIRADFGDQGIDNLDFLLKLYQHRAAMLRDYKIPTIQAELSFFKAKEPWSIFKEIALPNHCWQPYTSKPVDVQLVSGNHETMFWEPQVQLLAKKINLSLEKVEVRSPIMNFERAKC